MDWAMDHAGRAPARWAAILLGLTTCGADLGCARTNSFLRDEPPMLGATASPTSATAKVDESAPAASLATTESVVVAARERLETLQSYQVAINRQERVGTVLQEPEDVVLSIRRNPRAVRLQWQQGPHQGREVLFAERETHGLMQVNMADSAIPLPRLALPPDSPLVLRNSRHPITEAGFETIVRNLEKTIEENKAGDQSHGQISY